MLQPACIEAEHFGQCSSRQGNDCGACLDQFANDVNVALLARLEQRSLASRGLRVDVALALDQSLEANELELMRFQWMRCGT
jgi:hypothetical protein